jgi:hypothetical protein
MCKTFGVKIRENPKISRKTKTALQQPQTPINKEDAAISCVILSNFK